MKEMRLRRVWAGAFLVVMVAACGGGEMSLTEYADRLTAIMSTANQQGEALVAGRQGEVLFAEGDQLSNFTPKDLQEVLERVGEIESEVREATDAIEPPEQVAELHNLLFDTRFASAREALATRAGTAVDWEELSETPEMAAYRKAVTADKQYCIEFQTQLDATAERGVFTDTPWIPGELKEVVIAVLRCDTYPEHPEDMFRPPPTSTP
jgi:hypothetical protein